LELRTAGKSGSVDVFGNPVSIYGALNARLGGPFAADPANKLMEFLPTAVPPPQIEISFPNFGKKAVSRETLSHAAQKAKPTLQAAACRRT
jgi:hypothetical protein